MNSKQKSTKNPVQNEQLNKICDIEDSIAESKYFSPIQTRGQRKAKGAPLKTLNLLSFQMNPNKKKLPATENTDSKRQDKLDHVSGEEVQEKKIKWEPKYWNEMLENIRKMRSISIAPVDMMGCDKCSDTLADPKTQRYQKLVALMLSSQTKDQVTYEAMKRLKENELTPEKISNMDAMKLEELLKPVSFYKTKAKHLKRTAEILIEKYESDIPNNIEEMLKLPGVGPKMAHICMNTAWDTITGIGVDVHVHRISNRIDWVRNTTKDPEKTRKELESWLPKDKWQDVNHLLVGFGQTICTPINPKCNLCLNKEICPFPNKLKKVKF